jgi:hypothetical protein
MRWGWERYSPLTGVVAIVLWVVGDLIGESPDQPDGEADAAAWLSYVQDNDASLLVGGIIFAFGSVFFLWFLGSLRATLLAAEGAPGRLSSLAFASGALVALSTLMLVAPEVQAAFNNDDIAGETARTLFVVAESFFGGIELFSIPMLVATALVILATGVLARWVAWVSLVLALVMAIIPIGWLGVIFGLPLWTILMSVLLFLRPAGEPVATRPPA